VLNNTYTKRFVVPSVGDATRFAKLRSFFAKRKQSDAEFAGNSLLRMVIIDIVINTLLGTVT